ncbi:MAG: DUF1854 domain-containing protein [Ruminococcaceae bacterium]|nr:DUF1854 domain-containing protein [Oscillospiraceae bacterium]
MEDKDFGIANKSADINYLTKENVEFSLTQNGFVTAKFKDTPDFVRVHLSRVFPHDLPEEFISVSDVTGTEYGIIRNICDFEKETEEILRHELERRYFSAKITKILSVDEKFGSSVWTVETKNGMRVITLKDTFASIIRIGEDRAMIVDIDANRYEIESLSSLDKHSFRRIELFL